MNQWNRVYFLAHFFGSNFFLRYFEIINMRSRTVIFTNTQKTKHNIKQQQQPVIVNINIVFLASSRI